MSFPRRAAVVLFLAASVIPAASRHAHADLVFMTDGRSMAGRVLEESPAVVRLTTGTAAGPKEIELPRRRIRRIDRTIEEARRIQACPDSGRLLRWAAGYFFAGLETPAAECLRRALSIDPAVGERPIGEGDADWRTFANRVLLRAKRLSLPAADLQTLLGLAEWAHAAGLREEAAYDLRRAWGLDRTSKRIMAVADEWGVRLESWVELDLKPALRGSLFFDSIRDDGLMVPAEPGKTFLVLPLWYDPAAGARVLSKAIVRGKDRRGYYGIQVLPGPLQPDAPLVLPDRPVYERVELETKAGLGPRLVVKNTLAPRLKVGDETKQERLRTNRELNRPTRWLLLLIELPKNAPVVTLDWDDGGSEVVDLAYLRSVAAPLADPIPRPPESPAITASLEQLRRGSGAAAELAISQLMRLRQRLPPKARPQWSSKIDAKIITAGTRLEDQVRAAAWRYFVVNDRVSDSAIRCLANKGKRSKRVWLDIIDSRVRSSETTDPEVPSRLLGAILRSNDEALCRAALDSLLSLKIEPDWRLIGAASEAAQRAALDRIDTLPREQAARLLITLMKSVRHESAERIARQARSMHLRLTGPRDPIFAQWASASEPSERTALLTVLKALDLEDLIYSQPFVRIIAEARAVEAEAQVRSAALEMLVEQFLRRLEEEGPAGDHDGVQASFPLLSPLEWTDPVVQGLVDAVRTGPPARRLDALACLLRGGLAEEAERSLATPRRTTEEWIEVLTRMMEREDIAGCSGFLALLGRLLRPKHAELTDPILAHLDRAAGHSREDAWRVTCALKSGADFHALNELASVRPPRKAARVLQWMIRLGHLTAQDRQRFLAGRDVDSRERRLEQIDLRRAQLVDGRYGVFAVVETSRWEEDIRPPDERGVILSRKRWRVPRRTTLSLPPLTLRANTDDAGYVVRWGDRIIGRGVSRTDVRKVRGPDSFSPRLVRPTNDSVGERGWGWPDWQGGQRPSALAVGPAVLGSRLVHENPTANTMTLELSAYLRAGLEAAKFCDRQEADRLVPSPYKITLRYAAFASYYGVGVARPLPFAPGRPGERHLLNVMLVLERMDETPPTFP